MKILRNFSIFYGEVPERAKYVGFSNFLRFRNGNGRILISILRKMVFQKLEKRWGKLEKLELEQNPF